MVVSFIHFLANLLIAGILLRTIETRYPNSGIGKAIAVAY